MNEADLRRDFAPFSDAATETSVVGASDGYLVRLERAGAPLEFLVDHSGRARVRKPTEQPYSGIPALLASPLFSNLRRYADSQSRVLASSDSTASSLSVRFEIDGHARTESDVQALLQEPATDRMRVFVLDGPAGIGKTHFLHQLTRTRALDFLSGRSIAPVLHVLSRGSRLTNLRQMIAETTQLLKAGFDFQEVPVLVRHGLLLLAIDGFDELVDQEGYKDAWFAFQTVLESIGTAGTIVLSGRDTFFDEQAFYDRLSANRSRFDLLKIRLLPPQLEEAVAWLEQRGWPPEETRSEVAAEILRADSYILRPFFLSRLAETHGFSKLAGKSVRRYIVDELLTREAKLITKALPIPIRAVEDSLFQVYVEAAADMAERETDTVDMEFLALVSELAFEGTASSDDLKKLRHRMGSIALLEQDAVPHLRRFPHEEFLYYFLAAGFVSSVADARIPQALRRVLLGPNFLEVLAEELVRESAERLNRFSSNLAMMIRRERSFDRFPSNAASMLLTALAFPCSDKPFELRDLSAPYAYLADATPPPAVLEDVFVSRFDARDADVRNLEFRNTTIEMFIVNSGTRVGTSRPAAQSIRIDSGSTQEVIRDPAKIVAWYDAAASDSRLQHQTAPKGTSTMQVMDLPDSALLRHFERVCRRMLRQYGIREDADDQASRLLEGPRWAEIESVLARHGRIQRIVQPMGGPHAVLVRVVNPAAFIDPAEADEDSTNILREIADKGHLFPHSVK